MAKKPHRNKPKSPWPPTICFPAKTKTYHEIVYGFSRCDDPHTMVTGMEAAHGKDGTWTVQLTLASGVELGRKTDEITPGLLQILSEAMGTPISLSLLAWLRNGIPPKDRR